MWVLHCRLPGGPQEEGNTYAGVLPHLAVQIPGALC